MARYGGTLFRAYEKAEGGLVRQTCTHAGRVGEALPKGRRRPTAWAFCLNQLEIIHYKLSRGELLSKNWAVASTQAIGEGLIRQISYYLPQGSLSTSISALFDVDDPGDVY